MGQQEYFRGGLWVGLTPKIGANGIFHSLQHTVVSGFFGKTVWTVTARIKRECAQENAGLQSKLTSVSVGFSGGLVSFFHQMDHDRLGLVGYDPRQ